MRFDRDPLARSPAHDLALDCLEAGIEAATPERAVERHVHVDGDVLRVRDAEYDLAAYEEILVLGGGKGADDLAAALEAAFGDRLDGGLVVTHEPTAKPSAVDVYLGEHPVPGSGSVVGTNDVLERAEAIDERTLVIAAITGGASALLCAPAEGLSVDDVRTVTDGLLAAGASIDEINTVRRACSRIKGGGLARAAAPATVVGLLVSDVVGDDLEVIGSGPTVPVKTDPDAALAVLARYDIGPSDVETWLRHASPTFGSTSLDVENHVLVSGREAVDAASAVARDRGFEPCVLSTRIEGESRESGRFHAAIAAEIVDTGRPVAPPTVLCSGGETTVTVRGDGVGGPNLEFALAAAFDLPAGAVCAAIDTDGSDGGTDAAGALVDAETIDDPETARDALDTNDSYSFLDGRDALLSSGATGTNVNDLRVLVVPHRPRT